jgi:hypothetical protein
MINRSLPLKRFFAAFGATLVASVAFASISAVGASALSMTPTPNGHVGSGTALYAAPTGSGTKSCQSTASSGKALTSTTGEIGLTLKGCTIPTGFPGGSPCTSSGQASGTVVSGSLNYKLIYLDAAKTKFGLWLIPADASYVNGNLTPGTGTFAEFSCAGSTYKWTGSVMGQITNPGLNVSSATATLAFTTGAGGQTYQKVEGGGLISYHLFEKKNGGSAANLVIEASQSLAFEKAIEFLP